MGFREWPKLIVSLMMLLLLCTLLTGFSGQKTHGEGRKQDLCDESSKKGTNLSFLPEEYVSTVALSLFTGSDSKKQEGHHSYEVRTEHSGGDKGEWWSTDKLYGCACKHSTHSLSQHYTARGGREGATAHACAMRACTHPPTLPLKIRV